MDESFCLGFRFDAEGLEPRVSHTLNTCSRDMPTAKFVCFKTASLVCENFKISKPDSWFSLLSHVHRCLTVFVKNS